MGDFVVGYWPEVGVIVVHTLVRLRRSPNGSKALEARLKGRVFRRNVPQKWVTEARLTAIQRVWFLGLRPVFLANQTGVPTNHQIETLGQLGPVSKAINQTRVPTNSENPNRGHVCLVLTKLSAQLSPAEPYSSNL